jgi:3-methyladenine DNA glycosylase Tag
VAEVVMKLCEIIRGGESLGESSWAPPKWMYRDRRPANDDAYFENMTRVIFLAGLNWEMIDEKWPNFKKAFKNFSINEVAKFNESDIKRLMNDASIVRNRAKIIATINNARQFQTSRKEYKSFQSYLDQLDKSKNYAMAIEELGKKFNRLGSSSALLFLYSVGEKVKPPED